MVLPLVFPPLVQQGKQGTAKGACQGLCQQFALVVAALGLRLWVHGNKANSIKGSCPRGDERGVHEGSQTNPVAGVSVKLELLQPLLIDSFVAVRCPAAKFRWVG